VRGGRAGAGAGGVEVEAGAPLLLLLPPPRLPPPLQSHRQPGRCRPRCRRGRCRRWQWSPAGGRPPLRGAPEVQARPKPSHAASRSRSGPEEGTGLSACEDVAVQASECQSEPRSVGEMAADRSSEVGGTPCSPSGARPVRHTRETQAARPRSACGRKAKRRQSASALSSRGLRSGEGAPAAAERARGGLRVRDACERDPPPSRAAASACLRSSARRPLRSPQGCRRRRRVRVREGLSRPPASLPLRTDRVPSGADTPSTGESSPRADHSVDSTAAAERPRLLLRMERRAARVSVLPRRCSVSSRASGQRCPCLAAPRVGSRSNESPACRAAAERSPAQTGIGC